MKAQVLCSGGAGLARSAAGVARPTGACTNVLRHLPRPSLRGHAAAAASTLGSGGASTPDGSRPEGRFSGRTLSTTQLSDALAACAQSGLATGGGHAFLRGSLDHLSVYCLRRMRPRQLATVIRSFVALEYHPGTDWLDDFDQACFSHVGPLDPDSVTTVLQAMARFPDTTYRFPQAAYLKLKAHMEDFSFSQLCAMLRGLHAMQVAVEEDVLERAGQRMAALLRQMDARAASDAIQSLLVDGGGGEASQQGAGAAVTHPGEA